MPPHSSQEARREYQRRWRAKNPDYHRKWNSTAKNRAAALSRGRIWRAANPVLVAGQRARENAQRRRLRPVVVPLPVLHVGHRLFDLARQLAGRDYSEGMTTMYYPGVEDLRSEVVLAVLEGRDPATAVADYKRREAAWAFHTTPIIEGGHDDDGRQAAQEGQLARAQGRAAGGGT